MLPSSQKPLRGRGCLSDAHPSGRYGSWRSGLERVSKIVVVGFVVVMTDEEEDGSVVTL